MKKLRKKNAITVRAEGDPTFVGEITSSGASATLDSARTQVRVIGTRDATEKIARILAGYGFVCSGVEPERGYPDGTRYRSYLVAPLGRVK